MVLRNSETVEKLTVDQKLELAASLRALSSDWAKRAGLPSFRRVFLGDGEEETAFPSAGILAHSWNAALMGEVFGTLAKDKVGDAPALCYMPSLRLRAHPCGDGVSEDPFLLSSYAAALSSAVRGAGAFPCFTGVLPDPKGATLLDFEYEPRAWYDYFFAPFAALPRNDVAVSLPCGGEEKDSPNLAAAKKILLARTAQSGSVLCESAEGLAARLSEGYILAAEEVRELRAAYQEYRRLREAEARNEATPADIKAACRAGTALSDETLDAAADRAITLAELVCAAQKDKTDTQTDAETLARRAAEESIVLLANDGLLPLQNGCSVAVIGPYGEKLADALSQAGLQCAGFAEGYAADRDQSDELIPAAAEVAKNADAVVLFLVAGAGSAKLPANRWALLAALRKVNANIIAVLSPEAPCEVAFRKKVPAVVLADGNSTHGRAALADMLCGKISPSGRLAFSLYDDTDKRFSALVRYREEKKIKIGAFLGYRRSEAENAPAAFAFGHGLSYSSFKYSDLNVQYAAAEVTVKNEGPRDACEVVQLYVKKVCSAIPRPKKELKGFAKVFLRAGEEKRIKFHVPASSLAVFYRGDYAVEDGYYVVSVGASSSDIRLAASMRVRGDKFEAEGESEAAYLRVRSNILSGNFTFGKVSGAGARGVKLFRAGVILLLVSLLSAAAVFLLNLFGALPLFSQVGEGEDYYLIFSYYLIFVCPPMLIVGLVLTVAGWRMHAKAVRISVVLSNGSGAQDGPAMPEQEYEDLFDIAFTRERRAKERIAPVRAAEREEEDGEALAHYDAGYTLADTAGDLKAFCAAHGLSLGAAGAQRLLSAFCASHLILIRTSSHRLLPALAEALGEYFGSGTYYDDVSASETSSELSERTREEDGYEKTAAARALEDAPSQRHLIHAAILGNAKMPAEILLEEYLPRFSAFASESVRLSVQPNTWLLVASENASLPTKDARIAETACFIDLDLSEIAPAQRGGDRTLNYDQLVRLAQKCTEKHLLDEEKCWKKIDRLENAEAKISPYRFGNKLWAKAEKFSSALLALGERQEEALDLMVASCLLLPAVLSFGGGPERMRAAEEALEEESFPESRKLLADV